MVLGVTPPKKLCKVFTRPPKWYIIKNIILKVLIMPRPRYKLSLEERALY